MSPEDDRWQAIIFSEDLEQALRMMGSEWIYFRWSAARLPRKVEIMARLPHGGWGGCSIFGAITGEGWGLVSRGRNWKDEKLILQDGCLRTRVYHMVSRRLDQFCWKRELGNAREEVLREWAVMDGIRQRQWSYLVSQDTEDLVYGRGQMDGEILSSDAAGSWRLHGLHCLKGLLGSSLTWQITIRTDWGLMEGSDGAYQPWAIIPAERLQDPSGLEIPASPVSSAHRDTD